MSEAFTLFGREWLNWCLIGLIYTVLLSVPIVVGYTAIVFIMFAAVGAGAAAGGETGAGAGVIGALFGVTLGVLVMIVLVYAVHAWLHAGMVRGQHAVQPKAHGGG